MLTPDVGRIVNITAKAQSPSGRFFWQNGGIVDTTWMGSCVNIVHVIPKPSAYKASMRQGERDVMDRHIAIDLFKETSEPLIEQANVLAQLGSVGNKTLPCLMGYEMSSVLTRQPRIAEQYYANFRQDPKHPEWGARYNQVPYNNGPEGQERVSVSPSETCVLYGFQDYDVPDPVVELYYMYLAMWSLATITRGISATKEHPKNGRYSQYIGDLDAAIYSKAVLKLDDIKVENAADSAEIMALRSLDTIRNLATYAYMVLSLWGTLPTARLLQRSTSPLGTKAKRKEYLGADQAEYLDELIDGIGRLLHDFHTASGRLVKDSTFRLSSDQPYGALESGDHVQFDVAVLEAMSDHPEWAQATMAIILRKVVTELEYFVGAVEAMDGLRVTRNFRHYDDAMEMVKVSINYLNQIPALARMEWGVAADRIIFRSAFASHILKPTRLGIKYGARNPLENPKLTGGGRSKLNSFFEMLEYRPLGIAPSEEPSNWYTEAPVDHSAMVVPLVHWTDDGRAYRALRMHRELAITRSVSVAPLSALLLEAFPGIPNARSVFAVRTEVLDGPPTALVMEAANFITIDKDPRSMPGEWTGTITIPSSDITQARADLGYSRAGMPGVDTCAFSSRRVGERYPITLTSILGD